MFIALFEIQFQFFRSSFFDTLNFFPSRPYNPQRLLIPEEVFLPIIFIIHDKLFRQHIETNYK